MSQVGPINIENNNPQIPTQFDADVGFAIPVANVLEILGTYVTAGTVPVQTVGSGNTITAQVQLSQAIASTNVARVGLSAFNSSDFSVDANGFVSITRNFGATITAQSGGALSPTAGNWNIFGSSVAAGTTPVATSGSVSTLTVNIQRSQAIASTNATNVGLSAFDSARFTVDANGFVSASGTGLGQTITGNTGGARSPTAGNWNIVTSNSTVQFDGASSTLTQNFAITNLVLGSSLPALTSGTSNVSVGNGSLAALTSGGGNTIIGVMSALSLNTADNNVVVGAGALALATSAGFNVAVGVGALSNLTTGGNNSRNTALGYSTLGNLQTGIQNIAIGQGAGGNYTSSESSNILIAHAGVLAESNTTRIGTQGASAGQQNRCFVAGITGVTTSNSQVVTIDSTTGQLGVGSGGGVAWSVITGTSQAGAVNRGYIANNAGLVTITLPATSAVGDMIIVTGINNATGWRIAQNSGNQIFFGNASTTLGVGGSLSSSATRDAVTIVCMTANAVWQVISSVGNLTVV